MNQLLLYAHSLSPQTYLGVIQFDTGGPEQRTSKSPVLWKEHKQIIDKVYIWLTITLAGLLFICKVYESNLS